MCILGLLMRRVWSGYRGVDGGARVLVVGIGMEGWDMSEVQGKRVGSS